MSSRALESTFMVHDNGEDKIALNCKTSAKDGAGESAALIEIALCRPVRAELLCGQIRGRFS